MRILLSNDDGVHAPGIQTLAKALREFADVQVVAPDRNRSGASNSLTLESSLRTFTFYQLYPLRPALHHYSRHALRSPVYRDGGVSAVSSL